MGLHLAIWCWLAALARASCAASRPAPSGAAQALDAVEAAEVAALADRAATADAQTEAASLEIAVEATATVDVALDSYEATVTQGDTAAFDASPTTADVTAPVDAKPDSKPGPVAPAPATQGGPIAVEIGGTSDPGTQWTPWVTPGQPVSLIFGPQGGYHVWVSVCVPAATASPLAVVVKLTDTATGLPVPPGTLQLKTKLVTLPDHPGKLCRLAMPGFVDCACEMANRAVRVRVEVNAGTAEQPVVSWAEHAIVPMHEKGPCLAPMQACAPFL